jgi:hypothetical protein
LLRQETLEQHRTTRHSREKIYFLDQQLLSGKLQVVLQMWSLGEGHLTVLRGTNLLESLLRQVSLRQELLLQVLAEDLLLGQQELAQ